MWLIIAAICLMQLETRVFAVFCSASWNEVLLPGRGEGAIHKLWRVGLWHLAVVPLLYALAYKLAGRKRPQPPDYTRIAALEAELWPPPLEPEPPPPVRRIPVLTVESYGGLRRLPTFYEEAQAARGPARGAPFTPTGRQVIYVDARTRRRIQ